MKTLNFILYLVIAAFGFVSVTAAPNPTDLGTIFPKELDKINHFGTEFLLTVPPSLDDENAFKDDIVKVFVTSYTRTYVTVTGKYNYHEKRELRPYQTVIFDVPVQTAQVYFKSSYEPALKNVIFAASAFKVTADEPVSVYVVVKFNKTSDAYLAYPTSSLGKKYIVSSFTDASADYPGFYSLPSMTAIVASYDNTTVKFKLGGNDATSLGSIKSNDTIVKLMQKGDVWLLSSLNAAADLSGSVIESTMPVGVISGNQCANVPSGNSYCDYIVEMETPVKTWGKTFHVPIIKGRKKSPVIRIYASNPDTEIFLDGKKILTIETPGGVLGTGYQEYRINSDGNAQIGVITSNKPISITLFNTGVEEDAYPEPLGDPFQMGLVPEEQYQNEILYTTRGINNTTKYYESYLALTYKQTPEGEIPDDLELGIYDGKKFVWTPIKNTQPILHKPFQPNSKGEIWSSITFSFMSEGVFKIRSVEPVTAYFYGLTFNEGIGFPLAMGLQDITTGDTVKPLVIFDQNCNGDIKGIVIDYPEDAELRANLILPIFGSDSSSNYDFEPGEIKPFDTRKAEWTLKVRDKDKYARAFVKFRDGAGNDTTIFVEYFPLQLRIIPDYCNFGSIKSGSSITKEFLVVNETDKPVEFNEIRFFHENSKFELLKPYPFKIVQPGEKVSFRVKFNAGEFGVFTDSIGIGDGCRFHYKSSIIAKVGNPDINADDVTFYDVTITKPILRQFAVENKGKSALVITGYTGPYSPALFLTHSYENFPTSPIVIESGEYKTFDLLFNPTIEGIIKDSIVFHSDAQISDSVTYITGRGIKPVLSVESYNWGRKSIYSENNQISPYPVVNANNALKIENIGGAELLIKEVFINGDDKSKEAFAFDIGLLQGKTVAAGQTLFLPATFLPKSIGEHSIEITLFDENYYPVSFVLSGTGTTPAYEVCVHDFGTTLIDYPINSKVRVINISNLDLNVSPYCDTLWIYSLQTSPENAVAINSGFGSEGFRINLDRIDFPIPLAPGETLPIYVNFSAVKLGTNLAYLTPKTNAPSEKTYTLMGFGVNNELSIIAPVADVCLGESTIIDVQLSNNGTGLMEVGELKFINLTSPFKFYEPADRTGFDIPPGGFRIVQIEYTAKFEGVVEDKLFVLERQTGLPLDSASIFARTTLVERMTIINPIQQTASIGQSASIRLILSEGEDIAFAAIDEAEVAIKYDPDFLVPQMSNIKIGSALAGTFLIKDLRLNSDGNISFTLKTIAGTCLPAFGELVKMTFDVLLPSEQTESSLVYAYMTLKNTSCVRFVESASRISIKPGCAIDIRKVRSSGIRYELADVTPNPSINKDINIDFAIGIAANTDLSIFSTSGELVATPISEYLTAGRYLAVIPVSELNPGVYYYRVISGPFTETKKFVVVK